MSDGLIPPTPFAIAMSSLLSNTTDNSLPDGRPENGAQSAALADLLSADPKDFHLPTEVLLSMYGHEYFSSHRILWVRNCLMVMYCIFSAVGVMMNVCVVSLLVAWHQKALRNITNTFVLALASSDIVMSGFNMPMQTFYELMETVQFSEVSCRIIFSSFGLPMHISCLVILVIGIDRYWIIIYPLKRRMTRLTASGMLSLIVTISLISVIPIAVFSTSSPAGAPMSANGTQYHYCVEYWPSPEVRLLYSIVTFLVQFLLPLVLTALLYGRIYMHLHERRFRKRDLERKKRTNKILVGIVVCFFVCWTPWTVFSLTLEVHTYWTQKDFYSNNNNNNNESLQREVREAPAAFNTAHLQKLLLSCLQGLHKQQQNGGVEAGAAAACADYNISVLAPDSLLLFGRHTKLIDLLLKLLAMCSSCLNPCLYGCMTETMRMIMKKTVRRMHSFQHWISKLHGSLPSSSASKHKHHHQKVGFFENYRSDSFAAPVYVMKCCGFQFVIRTGFHQQHEQARNLLDRRERMDACAAHSTTGGKKRHRLGAGVVEAGLAMRCEAQATPGSKYLGQSSHEPLQLGGGGGGIAAGQKAGVNNSGNRDKEYLHLQYLDPASLTFLHRGSATLSVTEQSTKRTSLLPSSVTEKTPRNSFLVVKPNTAQMETSVELKEVISRCRLQTTSPDGEFENPIPQPNRLITDNQPIIVVCEASCIDSDGGGFDSIQGPTLVTGSPQAVPRRSVDDGLILKLAGADLTPDRIPHLQLVNIEVYVEEAAAATMHRLNVNCSSDSCRTEPIETTADSLKESNADGSNSGLALCPTVFTDSCPSSLNAHATSTPRGSLVKAFKTTPGHLAPVEEISGYVTSNEVETSASDTRGSLSITSQEKASSRRKRVKQTSRGDNSTSKAEKSINPVSGIVSALLPGQNAKRRSIWELRQKYPRLSKHSQSISFTSDTRVQKETKFQRGAWKEEHGTGKSDESSDDFTHFHKVVLQEAIQNAKLTVEDRRSSSGQPRPKMHFGRRISLPWVLRNDSCRKDNSEVRKLS